MADGYRPRKDVAHVMNEVKIVSRDARSASRSARGNDHDLGTRHQDRLGVCMSVQGHLHTSP